MGLRVVSTSEVMIKLSEIMLVTCLQWYPTRGKMFSKCMELSYAAARIHKQEVELTHTGSGADGAHLFLTKHSVAVYR